MPPAGTERAPRRPITADGALIPVGVDLRQDGAPEGVEFPGAGAPCAPQFRFGPLDCVGGSEAGDKLGDRGAEGALQQARLPLVREAGHDRSRTWRSRIGFLTSALHRASERDVDGRDGGRSGRAEEGASAASPSVRRQGSGRSKNRSGSDGRRPVVVLDRLRLEGKAFVEFGERDREADFRHVERVVVLQD